MMLKCLENCNNFEESRARLIEKNLVVKEYKDLGLYLVKYTKSDNLHIDEDMAKCRGLIMDYHNNVICIPPMKSIEIPSFDSKLPTIVYEKFIDGTMINVFYYNGWHISTRSCIGANCRWYSNKNFNEMFDESLSFDIEKLDPLYCYNFVLKHQDNRIVTQYEKNDIVLVGAFDLETYNYVDTITISAHLKNNYQIEVSIPERYEFNTIEEAYNYVSKLNFEDQGVVIKFDNWRCKLTNPQYNYVKYLRGNNRNIKYTYYELRRAQLLNEYLNFYPEYDVQFKEFTKELYGMTKKLFYFYQNFRVNKTIQYEAIEYPYRPLVYALHGIYLNNKTVISFARVKDYVNKMPSAQILFVLHYKEKNREEPAIVEAPLEEV